MIFNSVGNENMIIENLIFDHLQNFSEIDFLKYRISIKSDNSFGLNFIDLKNNVEFSFRIQLLENSLKITNDHRISRNKKRGGASSFLERLILIFSNIARRLHKKSLIVVFHLRELFGESLNEVKTWLFNLGFITNNRELPYIFIRNIQLE